MKYQLHFNAPKPRPLWKAVTYESLRLVCAGLLLVAVAGIAITLKGGA